MPRPARSSGRHDGIEGFALRGVNYWENADGSERRLFFSARNILHAIDAKTGKPIPSFGIDGVVDLREGLDRDPKTSISRAALPGRVFENLIILGSATNQEYKSAPGDIRAFDVRTGKLVWTFHTVPRKGEFGADTWPDNARATVGGANDWAELSVDAAAASSMCRPAAGNTTSMAAIVMATTCSPTASSRSTRAPASGCGTSRWCITTSGTSTTTPRRS